MEVDTWKPSISGHTAVNQLDSETVRRVGIYLRERGHFGWVAIPVPATSSDVMELEFMQEPRCSGWWPQLRRAFVFIRPHRRASLAILFMALAGAALSAVEPLLLKHVFDGLTQGRGVSTLLILLGGLLTIALVRELVIGVSNWLSWRVRLQMQYGVLEATVGRLHTLPVMFHRREGVGATLTRLDRGITGFVGALAEITSNVLPSLAYLGISIGVMLNMDWRLSLLVLVFTPMPALIGAWAANEQTARERNLLDRWSKIYSRFNEVLSGIVTVKSFTMEEEEKRRFLRGVSEANNLVVRGVGKDSGTSAAKNLVAIAARIAATGAGGLLILRGELTVGGLVAFLGYIGGLFGPVQGLTNIYQTLRRAAVSLDTIYSILDAHDTLGDAENAKTIDSVRGDVVFEDVSFTYGGDRPVLEKVSLRAKPGEVIALVGPSGGGKSTMMALLQRLYDPTEGSIWVDGHDIRTLRQKELRKHIGVVLQDALLFDDTIRNNIAYGKPGASQAEIEAAARAANAHAFIMQMPEGYDTLAGERGSRLSMGERQRIAIARALLKDPRILILDEATSALDAESEALVQDALATLIRGRTTFIVAHRLATVVDADRILVLKNGRILENGSHEELMERNGYYAALVRKQTRGLVGIRQFRASA